MHLLNLQIHFIEGHSKFTFYIFLLVFGEFYLFITKRETDQH